MNPPTFKPMSEKITGQRIYPGADGAMWFAPGDYGRLLSGEWQARPPSAPDVHLLGSLKAHEIVEHEDGTITVSPSILITGEDNDCMCQWHGFLERGVWRTA